MPAAVEGIPSNEDVERIGAGFYNTLASCRSGNLYCAGENQNLQCGTGLKNLRQMTRVEEVANVDMAEGGYCHTLIKTITGELFSMGCGEEGQRGIGLIDDEEETQLEVISRIQMNEKITQIAAGANHSVVLGESGVAYTFGANDVGQCGVPSDLGDDDSEEGDPVWSPKQVQLPPTSGKVIQVSAGYAHTALTTSTGQVFSFGQNENGQLGIGKDKKTKCEDSEPCLRPVEVEFAAQSYVKKSS